MKCPTQRKKPPKGWTRLNPNSYLTVKMFLLGSHCRRQKDKGVTVGGRVPSWWLSSGLRIQFGLALDL